MSNHICVSCQSVSVCVCVCVRVPSAASATSPFTPGGPAQCLSLLRLQVSLEECLISHYLNLQHKYTHTHTHHNTHTQKIIQSHEKHTYVCTYKTIYTRPKESHTHSHTHTHTSNTDPKSYITYTSRDTHTHAHRAYSVCY